MAVEPIPVLYNARSNTETPPVGTPYGSRDGVNVPEDAMTQEPLPMNELTKEQQLHDIPTLQELARLLRLERYQSRRGRIVQAQLYQTHVNTARISRLLYATRAVQRTLAECIKSEDKQSFTNLFNAFHDASCQPYGGPLESSENPREGISCLPSYPESFLDALPDPSRTALLVFINRIRRDGAFVAEKLGSLTQKELLGLLPDKGVAKSNESIFSSPARGSRASRHLGYVVDNQTDLLITLDYASPLETLVNAGLCIDGRSLEDNATAREVWATACANLISDQKPGSERFVPAVIELWANSVPWPGKERLVSWISQTLQNGSMLLEQPNRQSFRVRVQGRQEPTAEDDARIEAFYNQAVLSLLDLLADQGSISVIPQGAVALCRSICSRLRQSAAQRDAFCSFVLTRWLFSSFLPDAITLPEV